VRETVEATGGAMTDPRPTGAVPKVVISYARADSARVLELVQLLEEAGIGAWVDHEDITGAQLWAGEIAEAIDRCSVVLFFASPRAVASPSVVRELALAFEGRKDILPLYLEDVELPPAMRYQLAGVQRIELYEGTEAASRLPAVLRSLERLGVVPAPAGTTPTPVTRALQTGRTPRPPASKGSSSTPGNEVGLRQRKALIAAIVALVIAGIVGVVATSGDDDSSDGTTTAGAFDVAAGDPLLVRLSGPLDAPIELHSAPDGGDRVGLYPRGTGFQATGMVEGAWVQVTAGDGVEGWVDRQHLAPASGIRPDSRAELVESLGYRVVDAPINGFEDLVVLKGALDDPDLGHLELAFFFTGQEFLGVDGYPSHEIAGINPDLTTPGVAITYHLFDGPGTESPQPSPDGYLSTFFHARDGKVFPEPTDVVYPIDPRVAEAFGVPLLGTELSHR
jgi:hypothetical protein